VLTGHHLQSEQNISEYQMHQQERGEADEWRNCQGGEYEEGRTVAWQPPRLASEANPPLFLCFQPQAQRGDISSRLYCVVTWATERVMMFCYCGDHSRVDKWRVMFIVNCCAEPNSDNMRHVPLKMSPGESEWNVKAK
jgi:hypothetical protein